MAKRAEASPVLNALTRHFETHYKKEAPKEKAEVNKEEHKCQVCKQKLVVGNTCNRCIGSIEAAAVELHAPTALENPFWKSLCR